MMFSIITLSVGCSQKKDDKEQSSKEETQPVNKNQVSKASNNTKTSNRTDQAQKPPVSIPAPDFTLATTEGDLVSLSDLKGKVVLLNFWGTWCGPCRAIAPIIEELAADYRGKVKVGKLNVDNDNQVASQYGVRSIPALLIFKNGTIVNQIVGAVPKTRITEILDSVI